MIDGQTCCAEIQDKAAMKTLRKGFLRWKSCPNKAVMTRVSQLGTVLHYCEKHAKMRGHGIPSDAQNAISKTRALEK